MSSVRERERRKRETFPSKILGSEGKSCFGILNKKLATEKEKGMRRLFLSKLFTYQQKRKSLLNKRMCASRVFTRRQRCVHIFVIPKIKKMWRHMPRNVNEYKKLFNGSFAIVRRLCNNRLKILGVCYYVI